jgi:endonuclease/exonuclease/phosphatase family metal-dependent hydrolase
MNRLIQYFFVVSLLLLFSCESKSSKNSRSKNIQSSTLNAQETISKKSDQNSTKILTWNIQDLGQSKNDDEILTIAKIIKSYDIIAVQEVVAKDPRGAQAVAKIADNLNRMGSKWDYSISDPTKSPSGNMSERYAYFWKTSKVKLISKPFLDTELKDKCIREPYIAEFKLKNGKDSFFIVNFHSRVHSENPEKEIVYFKDYPKKLNSDRILILGDFNLNEKHVVWNDLYNIGYKSAIVNSPTTLKRSCKRDKYLNYAIDNIFYDTQNIELINSGRIDFVGECSNLSKARTISDHLPVYIDCIIR